eukprot:Skav236805  [mRNA]  locus=scaffold3611:42680:53651:- [translate_table: standard]
MTRHDFLQQCALRWLDLVQADLSLEVVRVHPTPAALSNVIAHVIVSQTHHQSKIPLLVHCHTLPALAQTRAALVDAQDTVQQLFRVIQHSQACEHPARPCYVEGPEPMQRAYAGEEIFPKQKGMYLHGGLLQANDPPSEDPSDAENSVAESDTTVPSDDPSDESQASVDLSDPEDASPDHDFLQPQTHVTASSQLLWNEVPSGYRLNDVIPQEGSWSWAPELSDRHLHPEEESHSLMQTQRGQSSARARDPDSIPVDFPATASSTSALEQHLRSLDHQFPQVAVWCVTDTFQVCTDPQICVIDLESGWLEDQLTAPWLAILETAIDFRFGFLPEPCWLAASQPSMCHLWLCQTRTSDAYAVFVSNIPEAGTVAQGCHRLTLQRSGITLRAMFDSACPQHQAVSLLHNTQQHPMQESQLDQVLELYDGLHVVFHLTADAAEAQQEIDTDQTDLMQRSRSRSPHPAHPTASSEANDTEEPSSASNTTPSTQQLTWTVLYSDMPENLPVLQAPAQGPSPSQVAQLMSFPANEIVALHIVSFLLAAHQDPVILVQCLGDRVNPATEAVVMLDVAYNPAPEEEQADDPDRLLHSLHIARKRHTFRTLAATLKLDRFLQLFAQHVEIRLNGQPWQQHDPTPQLLQHGDHIRVIFDSVHRGAHAPALSDWLYSQGLEPWPALLQAVLEIDAFPMTAPFVAAEPSQAAQCEPSLLSNVLDSDGATLFNSWFIGHRRFPRTGTQQETVTTAAYSTHELADAQSYQRMASVATQCAGPYACEVYYDGRKITDDVVTRRHTGMAVTLLMMEKARPAPSSAAASSGISLMQRRAQRSSASSDTGGTLGEAALSTAVHWDFPVLDQNQPHDAIAFQQLEQLFNMFARPVSHLQPETIDVAVYYLSEQRQVRCTFARVIRLQHNPLHWRRQLIQPWLPMIDAATPIAIYVVTPLPYQNEAPPGIGAFVLITQHFTEDSRPVLLTVAEHQEYLHMALFLTPTIVKRQVLTEAGLSHRCYTAEQPPQCLARYGWQPITDDPPLPIPAGAGIHIDVFQVDADGAPAAEISVPASETAHHQLDSAFPVNDDPSQHAAITGPVSQESVPSSVHITSATSASLPEGTPIWDLPRTAPDRPVVMLEQCLPDTPLRSRPRKIPIPGIESFMEKLMKPPQQLCVALPAPDLLSVAVRHAMAEVLIASPSPSAKLTAIEVYTDGSSLWNVTRETKAAAWAFLVIRRYDDSTIQWMGWSAGNVADPASPNELPAWIWPQQSPHHPDSFASEAEAIYRALRWILASPDAQAGVPVSLVSDAWTLVQAVDGSWSVLERSFVNEVLVPLAEAARALLPFHILWQKAHDGCLFNELVDHLAATQARQETVQEWPAELQSSELQLLPWAWMYIRSGLTAAPYTFEEECLQIPVPPPTASRDSESWTTVNHHPATELRLDLTIATFNVNSLKDWTRPKGQQQAWSARSELLRNQAHGFHVLFLQETRVRHSREWNGERWSGFAAAACQGQGGMEIWINTARATTCHMPQQRFDRSAMVTQAGHWACQAIWQSFLQVYSHTAWVMPVDALAAATDRFFSLCLPVFFPRTRRKPRPTWIQPSTWSLLTVSRQARRAAFRLKHHFRTGMLRQLFYGWASCCKSDKRQGRPLRHPLPPPGLRWQQQVGCALAWHQSYASTVRSQLSVSLQQDEATYLADLAASSRDSLSQVTAQSWVEDLCVALKWAAERCHRSQPLPDPSTALEPWISLVREDPTRWQKMCRSLRHRTNLWSQIMAQKDLWEQDFQNILHPPLAPTPEEPQKCPTFAFQCDQCTQSFATAKGLSVHRMKQHNEPAHARRYMPDPQTCGACLQRFQNSQKLRQHLQWRSNGCLHRLETLWTPMSNEEVQAIDTVYGRLTSYREPALQCLGPELPPKDVWLQSVPAKAFPQVTPFAALDAYQQALSQWLHGVLDHEELPPMPDSANVAARDRHRLLEATLQQLQCAALGSAAPRVREALLQALGRRTAVAVSGTVDAPAASIQYQAPVLPTVNGELYVLYFYAGHRREGDFHQCLSELRQAYQVPICVLPIDIVYHQRLCNMMDAEAQRFWMAVIQDKACVGLLGAPPCETWSVARWRAVLLGDKGPKPVRSAARPWALLTASMRELRQLAVANTLLQVWLKMAAVATIHNISWAMEHPAEATQIPQAASIWKLPQVQALFAAGAQRHTILQGFYGAVSAKPTTFAVYRMPAFVECAQRWRLRGVRPADWIQLCGKNSAGEYKTMAAKAYPRALNFLLAEAFVQRERLGNNRILYTDAGMKALRLGQQRNEALRKQAWTTSALGKKFLEPRLSQGGGTPRRR